MTFLQLVDTITKNDRSTYAIKFRYFFIILAKNNIFVVNTQLSSNYKIYIIIVIDNTIYILPANDVITAIIVYRIIIIDALVIVQLIVSYMVSHNGMLFIILVNRNSDYFCNVQYAWIIPTFA